MPPAASAMGCCRSRRELARCPGQGCLCLFEEVVPELLLPRWPLGNLPPRQSLTGLGGLAGQTSNTGQGNLSAELRGNFHGSVWGRSQPGTEHHPHRGHQQLPAPSLGAARRR